MSSLSLGPDLERIKTVAADKQSLFLFNVLSSHYRNVALLDATIISAQSSALLDDLIVALRAPGLHRAHRNLLGRCFVTILRRIDKGPFEVTNKIMNLLSKERDERYKWNATVVLGQIFENVGDEVISLVGELVVVMGKMIRPSSAAPGVKAAALRTIAAALSQKQKLEDALQKDLLRLLKTCLPDKSTTVHIAAYEVSMTISLTIRADVLVLERDDHLWVWP